MQNYHIERPLAQGSTSSVFRVLRVSDRSSFVLKRIPLEDAAPRDIAAAEREVALFRQLDHPCIVGLVDSFEVKLPSSKQASPVKGAVNSKGGRGDLCLILEPMHHGDIAHVLANLRLTMNHTQQTISEKIVMSWFCQIALGIHYLHSRSVCFADIKSQNVFVDENVQFVAIGDLGSAHVISASGQQQQNNTDNSNMMNNTDKLSWEDTAIGGTPAMFSPERFQGAPASFASDIWALGILLFEMAAISHPFANCRDINQLVVRVCKGEVPTLPGHVIAAAGTRDMQQLISLMLRADPAQRPNIDQVLRHPYVQKHLERFFRMLLAPPDAIPLESATTKKSSGGGGSGSLDHLNDTNNSSQRKSDRWKRFVTGVDKFNPHRLFLHPALEVQMQLFLPQRFAEYKGGAGGGAPLPNNNSPTKSVHALASSSSSAVNLMSATTTPSSFNNSFVALGGGRGRSSGGGPSSIQNIMSQDPRVLQHQQQVSSSSVSPQRVAPLTATVDNASLVPSVQPTNVLSQHQSSSFLADDNVAGNTSPNRRRIGRSKNAALLEDLRPPVHPAHMSPDALQPYQHQQLPLSVLRGQRTAAPFFVEDGGANNSNRQQQRRQTNNNSNSGENPNFFRTTQSTTSSSLSPLRGSGGGVTALAPSPLGVNDTIARMLGKK